MAMKQPSHFIIGCVLVIFIFFIVRSHGLAPPFTKYLFQYDDVTGFPGIFITTVGGSGETKSRVKGSPSAFGPSASVAPCEIPPPTPPVHPSPPPPPPPSKTKFSKHRRRGC